MCNLCLTCPMRAKDDICRPYGAKCIDVPENTCKAIRSAYASQEEKK